MSDLWHVTWPTHNSRVSERMVVYRVKPGRPFALDERMALLVANTIRDIVLFDGLKVFAFNVCLDHVHLLLEATPERLPIIIGKLKARSARAVLDAIGVEYKSPLDLSEQRGITPCSHAYGRETRGHIWGQKFGAKHIDCMEQFRNTTAYIANNRRKHGLPKIDGWFETIGSMIDRCGDEGHAEVYRLLMESSEGV